MPTDQNDWRCTVDERKIYIKKEGEKKKKETNKSKIYRIYTTSRSIWFIQLENREEKQDDGFDASN